MPSISINTNLSSLIAQQSLKQSSNKLNLAVERMSTGFKINHAKDNAANYSISTNMTTKIGAYQVAEDNVAMGLDLLSTANGSLDQISDKLSRLRALAEQSANGTYGAQSRSAINAEANALVDEIERLYNTTEYNGINLAKGRVVDTEESKFIKDVDRRDTSKMTTLASVKIDEKLEYGTYSISTPEELAKLATMTNNGLIGDATEFVLADNIDLRGYSNWTPIGWSDLFVFDTNFDIGEQGLQNLSKAFSGTFDGNGYKISNLTIIDDDTDYKALFGYVFNGEIVNLEIENAEVASKSCVASLAGCLNNSIVSNCFASGEVNGSYRKAAGLVGDARSYSEIIDSYSVVTVNMTGAYRTGGIVASAMGNSIIKNCFSTGNLTGVNQVGGISGYSENATIDNCYFAGVINGGYYCGGILGAATENTLLKNSYFAGEMNLFSTAGYSGGLVGAIVRETWQDENPNVKISDCSVLSYVSHTKFSSIIGTVQNPHGDNRVDLQIKNININNEYYLNNIELYKVGTYYNTKLNSQESGITYITDISTPFAYETNSITNSRVSDMSFQVGTSFNKSSVIGMDIGFNIIGIQRLRNIGMNDNDYLSKIDILINSMSEKSTEFGAAQNRLESALDEISTQYENLVSSRSTLRDADISEVSSEYIRQQILQEASATLMSTANQNPMIALQLL